jgi:hypothetical protein
VKLHRSTIRALQGWLVISALVLSTGLVWKGLIARPHNKGADLIPAARCPDGRPSHLPGRYNDPDYQLLYNSRDCYAVDLAQVIGVARQLRESLGQLGELGLPRPLAPFAVALRRNYPRKGFVAHAKPGLHGAIEVAVPSEFSPDLNHLLDSGLAELAIGELAPGLEAAKRHDLALGYGVALAENEQTVKILTDRLAAGDSSLAGLYYSWLLVRAGRAPLREALISCRRSCRLSGALGHALARRGLNERALRRQWIGRATRSPATRLALARRLS